jgi:hypothetical protein
MKMLVDLTPEQRQLASIMSEVSEKCFSAGWIMNLEYVLWHALKNGERKYGHDTITKSDIQVLNQISSSINSWIYFDETAEETGIAIDKWEIKYEGFIKDNPKVVAT